MPSKKFYPHSPPSKPYQSKIKIPENYLFEIEGAETFDKYSTIVLSTLHPDCKELHVDYDDGYVSISQYGYKQVTEEDIQRHKAAQEKADKRYEKRLAKYKIDKKEWDAQFKVYDAEQKKQKEEHERREYERLKAVFESKKEK
jgi:hypothetical protein